MIPKWLRSTTGWTGAPIGSMIVSIDAVPRFKDMVESRQHELYRIMDDPARLADYFSLTHRIGDYLADFAVLVGEPLMGAVAGYLLFYGMEHLMRREYQRVERKDR